MTEAELNDGPVPQSVPPLPKTPAVFTLCLVTNVLVPTPAPRTLSAPPVTSIAAFPPSASNTPVPLARFCALIAPLNGCVVVVLTTNTPPGESFLPLITNKSLFAVSVDVDHHVARRAAQLHLEVAGSI